MFPIIIQRKEKKKEVDKEKVFPSFPGKSTSTSVIRTLKNNKQVSHVARAGKWARQDSIGTGQSPVPLGYKVIHNILQNLLATVESLKSKKHIWQDSFPWKQPASRKLLFLRHILN